MGFCLVVADISTYPFIHSFISFFSFSFFTPGQLYAWNCTLGFTFTVFIRLSQKTHDGRTFTVFGSKVASYVWHLILGLTKDVTNKQCLNSTTR